MTENIFETDVLVIGGGIAGCFAALKAKTRKVDVILVDKAFIAKSGGTVAAGAGYMFFNSDMGHNLTECLNAIGKNGEYLNDREWSEIIMKDSWKTYQDLISWGVEFPVDIDRIEEQYQPLTMKDFSGMKVLFGQIFIRRGNFHVLRKEVANSSIKIFNRVMVTDLIKNEDKVTGALGFSIENGDTYIFKAKSTILSTGFSSFKPAGAGISDLTGDGEAMAYRAGAEITGKEFSSKYITLSSYPYWRSYAGFVAYPHFTDFEGNPIELRNINNVGFWDLAMDDVIHKGKGPISWNLERATIQDIELIEKTMKLSEGTDIIYKRQGLEINPGIKIQVVGGGGAGSTDSQTSGIWPINKDCATVIPGLYVAGECCGTRYVGAVHTARGFGLTGSAVTGTRAGIGAADYALRIKKHQIDEIALSGMIKNIYSPLERKGGFNPRWVTQILQNTMIPYFISHIKHEKRLTAALNIIEFIRDHLVPKLYANDSHELRLAQETKNMVLIAEMILRSSLLRKESRGQHYREDYPHRDDPDWLAWIKIKRGEEDNDMNLLKEPVPQKWWPDLNEPYEERYPRRFPGE